MTTVAPPTYQDSYDAHAVPPYTQGAYKQETAADKGEPGWSVWTDNVSTASSSASSKKSIWGNAAASTRHALSKLAPPKSINVWGSAADGRDGRDTNVWGAVYDKRTLNEDKSYAVVWGNGTGVHGRDAADRFAQ